MLINKLDQIWHVLTSGYPATFATNESLLRVLVHTSPLYAKDTSTSARIWIPTKRERQHAKLYLILWITMALDSSRCKHVLDIWQFLKNVFRGRIIDLLAVICRPQPSLDSPFCQGTFLSCPVRAGWSQSTWTLGHSKSKKKKKTLRKSSDQQRKADILPTIFYGTI